MGTSVLLYLLSAESEKADKAEQLLASGATISVQVLNEFANVASRKLAMAWPDIRNVIAPIRALCRIETALQAGCTCLYTEDMQQKQKIERRLTIRNPFVVP